MSAAKISSIEWVHGTPCPLDSVHRSTSCRSARWIQPNMAQHSKHIAHNLRQNLVQTCCIHPGARTSIPLGTPAGRSTEHT
eukprot:7137457-Prorocentrum_lima.AAC.1